MEAASRRSAVDAVAGLAAELRAGSPVDAALTAASPALRPPQAVGDAALAVARRVAAAVEVAESSGAPLADVLDRLDSHLRAVDRGRAAAVAQAAGARASSLMLACMPVVGLGLGIAVGIDPFDVLLHSALGAACLAGAVVLQLCGLAWSARLSRLEAST
jgi:tight adherence protein B